jgi:hypothetical protein
MIHNSIQSQIAQMVGDLFTWEQVSQWTSRQYGGVGYPQQNMDNPFARDLNEMTRYNDTFVELLEVPWGAVEWIVQPSGSLGVWGSFWNLAQLAPWAQHVLDAVEQSDPDEEIQDWQFQAMLDAHKPEESKGATSV